MKKIFLTTLATVSIAVLLSSCLKDKGFENGEYGLNGVTDRPGVGFPEGARSNNSFAVNAIATPQTINAPMVNLLADKPASQDVHVVLQLDPSIVTAYNTANGTSLVIPTSSQYSINTLTVTIPAGQRFAFVPIVIPNAAALSLTATYALGFKILSVDADYIIASNLQRVLISFSVKNAYDGRYTVVSGFVQRYLSPGVPNTTDGLSGSLAGNPDVYLVTTGATCVTIPAPNAGGDLKWFGGGSAISGIDPLSICVDPATNTVTTTSAQNGTLANWSGHVNRYDPATRTFYLAWRWNPSSTVRELELVLTYKEPRP